jgi:hypothetical protein
VTLSIAGLPPLLNEKTPKGHFPHKVTARASYHLRIAKVEYDYGFVR